MTCPADFGFAMLHNHKSQFLKVSSMCIHTHTHTLILVCTASPVEAWAGPGLKAPRYSGWAAVMFSGGRNVSVSQAVAFQGAEPSRPPKLSKNATPAMPHLCQAPQGPSTVSRAELKPCHAAHLSPGPGPSLVCSLLPHHSPHTLLHLPSPPPPILFLSVCLSIHSPPQKALLPPLCLSNWN